jgi:hypothetical protein
MRDIFTLVLHAIVTIIRLARPRTIHILDSFMYVCASCGFSVVVVEHTAQAFSPSDGSRFCGRVFHGSDQPVLQALVVPLSVIMNNEFPNCTPQGIFAKRRSFAPGSLP